jgi:hypothetical protein
MNIEKLLLVFICMQGGDVSNAYINVESETSLLELGGYATRFTAFDSFELTLSHR